MIGISVREDALYWPDYDTDACYNWVNVELYSVDEILAACDNKRSIVHAGGNVGSYALKFSTSFDNVYVFEPDETNFKCLSLNTKDKDNIHSYNSALGEQQSDISLNNNDENNCGTFYVSKGGNITMVSIDSMDLSDVDCIHLDVEGYEFFALKGAISTIEKYKPLIVVEWLDHNEKYGVTKQDIIDFLANFGYTKMKQTASDMMFKI